MIKREGKPYRDGPTFGTRGLGEASGILMRVRPRTSVLLPVYNGASTLERAFASVASQTLPVDEVIVVDDGSTDKTAQILSRWQTLLPLIIIKNSKNLGLTLSLQKAAKRASGDIFLRVDADDEWLPNHCKALINLVSENRHAVLFSSLAEMCDPSGGSIGQSEAVNEKTIRRGLLWDNPLVHSSTAISKSAYHGVGGYLGPTYAEDYDLWIRLLKNGRFACTDLVTVRYFISEDSVSRIRRQRALSIRLRLQAKAIRAFFLRHPVSAFLMTFVVIARQSLNWLKLA